MKRYYSIRGRWRVLVGVLGVMMAVLVVRSIDVMVVRQAFYQKQGDARHLRTVTIPASRGMILDRHGEPLAVSTPVKSLCVNPKELLKKKFTPKKKDGELNESSPEEGRDNIQTLADALGVSVDDLNHKLARHAEREFLYLRRHMNPAKADEVLALDVPGVFAQQEYKRFYPQGESAAQLIGFTDIDDQAQEGLEKSFDEWLKGVSGKKRVLRGRNGGTIEDIELIQSAEPGKNLTLSIDRRIQYLTWRELSKAMEAYQAKSASAVVLDIKTGEVLSMANLPSYNPNGRRSTKGGVMRNRAMTDVFEPGSVVKALTVAAALENGNVTPQSIIDTTPGTYSLHGHTIHDVRNYGAISVTKLLTKSSNVAATKLALDMPTDHLHDVMVRFGLGSVTGAGFPGESAGILPEADGWGPVEKATISYGYGLSVTTLQLAQAYATLGNQGRLVRPTFVHQGDVDSHAVIDPSIAKQIVTMLETVTGDEGTAMRARVPGYRVAGKTGTSRKASGGGYGKRYISVFAGLVPVSDPRFAMVVMVDDPQGAFYGGVVAAPVFSNVMQGALRMMNVPPDNVAEWYKPLDLPTLPAPNDDMPPNEAESVPGMWAANTGGAR